MTVGIDLSDPGSPCGCVHIRNKTAVGERMALAARALAFGESVKYTGPVADKTFAVSGSEIQIGFTGHTAPMGFRTIAQTNNTADQG
jgi:sialate O-acetylesterase